jgi:hypothetical protein
MIRHGSQQAMTQRISIRSRRSLAELRTYTVAILALGVGAGLLACGAAEEPADDGPPAFSGLNPGASNGIGGNGSPQNPTVANNGPSGTNPSIPSQNQTGSAPPSNGGTPPANPPPEGSSNGAPLDDGTDQNSGGAMAPGAGGASSTDPAAPGGTGGTGNTAPPGNPGGTGGSTTLPEQQPSAGSDISCPGGATFCSGFESDVLPMGAIYQSQPTVELEFDTTVKHAGARSLKVVSTGGFNIREVVVAIPGQSFWVRLFVQTSDVFGDNNHDSLFVASTAASSQDNNAENGPEFSEQGNQIILNANDSYYSPGGPGFPQGEGPQLSANTWHCEEAFYNGGTGDTQIFSDGEQLIDAVGFTRLTYQTFRFGYIGFNTVRTVWFDDVVVAPNRIGCN